MMEQAIADAGLAGTGRRRRRGAERNRERAWRVDRDLMSAGIEPGHPSLYPTSEGDLHEAEPGAGSA
jgi:hypothetical protein